MQNHTPVEWLASCYAVYKEYPSYQPQGSLRHLWYHVLIGEV